VLGLLIYKMTVADWGKWPLLLLVFGAVSIALTAALRITGTLLLIRDHRAAAHEQSARADC
jgi:hypothetical protein